MILFLLYVTMFFRTQYLYLVHIFMNMIKVISLYVRGHFYLQSLSLIFKYKSYI